MFYFSIISFTGCIELTFAKNHIYWLAFAVIRIRGCCSERCETGGIFTRIYLPTYSLPIISNKLTMKQPSRHDDNVKSDRDYLSIDFYSVNN